MKKVIIVFLTLCLVAGSTMLHMLRISMLRLRHWRVRLENFKASWILLKPRKLRVMSVETLRLLAA